MERSFRRVIGFDGARLYALLVDEFDRRDKEVHEESPFLGVEIVEQVDYHWVIKALIPEVLADVSPVFPFHVGIIVFVILPRACVVNRPLPFGVVVEDCPVDELRTVVTVEPAQAKRESCFDARQRLKGTMFTLAERWPAVLSNSWRYQRY